MLKLILLSFTVLSIEKGMKSHVRELHYRMPENPSYLFNSIEEINCQNKHSNVVNCEKARVLLQTGMVVFVHKGVVHN